MLSVSVIQLLSNLLPCAEILPRILGNTEVDYEFKDGALIEFLIEMIHLSNTVTWIVPLNVKIFPNGILAQVPH